MDNIISHIFWVILQTLKSETGGSNKLYDDQTSGVPFPSSGDLPKPAIKPETLALQAGSLPSEATGKFIIFILHNSQGNGNRPTLELMINRISNNKGDTDQTYFKKIVGATCAILQVNCPRLPPVHSWNSHLKHSPVISKEELVLWYISPLSPQNCWYPQ